MKLSTLGIHDVLLRCACAAIGCAFAMEPIQTAAADADPPRSQADAERRSIKQDLQLGAAYLAGRGVPQNFAQSAYWYERAANAGDPLAQNQIGYFYQTGIGVPRDLQQAVHWYQRSASGGYLRAKVNLGVAYLWGTGVKKDTQLGYDLIHEAALRNFGLADSYMGEIYYFGLGVPVDREAARSWYERGTRAHDCIAEYRLAEMLVTGIPSKQDLLKGEKLFRQSVKGGFVAAQHSLGLLLVNHPELPSQPNEAIIMLKSASEKGTWKSSAVLGAIYRDGKGVPLDHAMAYYYFRLAQLQGGEGARSIVATDLAILSRELNSNEIERLVAETDAWVKEHPLTLQFVYKDTGSSSNFPVFAISAANDDTHAGRLVPAPPTKAEH
jgi:TPR repeat protein